MKRLLDLGLAVAAVIVLLPVLTVIAVLVWVDSGRPVLFRQVRVGRGEGTFQILKFRTMFADAEQSLKLTAGGDARVTRVGVLLRRYKLDELPQLFNVIRGEMSLVGPRPEVPEFVKYYSAEDRRLIFSVRPGVTDVASIKYRNEGQLLEAVDDPRAYYVEVLLPKKLALCREYVLNRSLGADLAILWRTASAIVR